MTKHEEAVRLAQFILNSHQSGDRYESDAMISIAKALIAVSATPANARAVELLPLLLETLQIAGAAHRGEQEWQRLDAIALTARLTAAPVSETAAIVQVLPLPPQPETITTSTHGEGHTLGLEGHEERVTVRSSEKNYRRLLEESNLPIELAVEIADKLEQLERELDEERQVNAQYHLDRVEMESAMSATRASGWNDPVVMKINESIQRGLKHEFFHDGLSADLHEMGVPESYIEGWRDAWLTMADDLKDAASVAADNRSADKVQG
jgi:hypothetical protein